ncbi:putative ubiquinone biosynthesis monooxygenase [Asimina triloba]
MTIYPTKLTSMTLESYSPSVETYSQSPNLKETSTEAPLYYNTRKQKNLGCLAKLQLDDGNSLYARLVVGADGSKSRIREISGIKTTGWNYSQNAVICTVEHAVDNHCAWQRFLPSGPIALLPIGDKYSNIVWTMNPKEASDHKLMSEVKFVEAVNHALDYGYGPHPSSGFFGQYWDKFLIAGAATPSMSECFQVPPKVVKLASGRMAFPLSLMHANDYASYRVVLIGDAAHTVHPLAGQGVNLGFEDALTLSKVIAKGISVGSDIGETFASLELWCIEAGIWKQNIVQAAKRPFLSLLKKYESERKPANIMMMAILDGFQKAYSVDLGPLNFLRAVGFQGAQHFGPLKRSIISYATDLSKTMCLQSSIVNQWLIPEVHLFQRVCHVDLFSAWTIKQYD